VFFIVKTLPKPDTTQSSALIWRVDLQISLPEVLDLSQTSKHILKIENGG
jgi:hypothetical protein